MTIDTHLVFAFLHILVFVYWLGGDLGVFLPSLASSEPGLGAEAKAKLREVAVLIDMAPRTCLVLTPALGLTLAVPYGSPVTGAALWAVWAVCVFWVWLVWQVHWKHGTAIGKTYWRVDFAIRVAAMLGFLGFSLYCLATGGPIASRWLSVKMLLFAGIISLGITIRLILLRQTRPVPAGVVVQPMNPWVLRNVVLGIWGLLLVIAFLGVVKPF